MFKNSLIILLLITLIATSACKKQSGSVASNPTAPATVELPSQQPTGGEAAPVTQTKYFKGSIGSTLDLQMKLVRSNDGLTGNYFYPKVGTRIALKGNVDKDGLLSLEESDASGKPSGVFKGLWKTDTNGIVSLVGNWSKPDSDKQTAFSLHEEPIEFSGTTELVGKSIKESNKKLNYSIDVGYPEITGALDSRFEKFNQAARSLVTRKIAEFKKDMAERAAEEPAAAETSTPGSDLGIGYTIAFAKDDLVSVEFDIGGYYQGAAHPNSYTQVINYDAKNGKLLKLSELFKPGAKYLQAVSAYSIKDLTAQSKAADASLPEESIASGAGAEEKNYQNWTITRTGLSIAFDAYQVGPYAAGPQRVVIPYSALKDTMKADGPLAGFVK